MVHKKPCLAHPRVRLLLAAVLFAQACWSVAADEDSTKGKGGIDGRSVADAAAIVGVDPVVERGRYLAHAGNCMTCHTKPGGEPFAGGVAFETPFGTIYSTNITPDPETGIGKWTSDQFLQALRKGVRPNGAHLYPVFPYTAFTKITDEDATALFAYLKSVPAVRAESSPNELSFPFNQRWLMGIWKMLFFEEGRFEPDAARSAEWNRGAYLVEALGHCSACHSPRNFLGAERSDLAMTGGEHLDRVPGGAIRPWSAPNLTSAPSGLAGWSVDEIASYLKTGVNSYASTYGPMNKVIMNGTRHLSDADVRAMAVYLKSLPAKESGRRSGVDAEALRAGEALYDVHCGTCHLPTGLGAPDSAPRLAGSPVVQASNPASLINVILYGAELSDPPPLTNYRERMKAFADELSDEEIAVLATYVRNAWGNAGSDVTAKQVARQR